MSRGGPIGLVEAPRQAEVEQLRALADSLMTRNLQLEHALESRVVIEQAKGVLAERYALDVDAAFELLRRAARSNRIRLRALAQRVVAERETPREIAAAIGSGSAR